MRVPLNIWDYLERAAFVHGDRVAIVDEPGVPGSLGRVTYAELRARARGMAAALDRMGVEDGARVAIVSPNAARFLVAFFGVSGFNRILVPINFRLTAPEIGYIVEHSGASVLLVDPDLAPAVAATPTDPGLYEAVKVSVEKPMIHQVYADVVCLSVIAPSVEPHSAATRSSADLPSMNVASTPVAVEAYSHIDPDIGARAGI